MGDMNSARVTPIFKPGDSWVEQSEPQQERKARPKPKKEAVKPVLISEEEQEHQFDELA